MTTPLAELLAQVPALNDPAEPFSYAVVGNTITGSWDIVNAQYLEWAKAGTIDKDYVIVVDFSEAKGTFDFEETKHEKESAVTVDDGTISFGSKKSVFVVLLRGWRHLQQGQRGHQALPDLRVRDRAHQEAALRLSRGQRVEAQEGLPLGPLQLVADASDPRAR